MAEAERLTVKTEDCTTCGERLKDSRCDSMEKMYGVDYERVCAMCCKKRSGCMDLKEYCSKYDIRLTVN